MAPGEWPGEWPSNLPDQLTSFVGRAWERDQASGALSSTRLLVLTGAGGSGKTRLALEVAAGSPASFPDGAWWVELAPLTTRDQVEGALAGVLGVRPLPGRTPTQAIVARLADGQVLVVLDNCEHVLDAAADLCEALLRGCPHVSVLATSRIPLGVPGEADWRVPSLSLPSTDSPDVVAGSDAARLFVERATKVRPGFALTSENLTPVARICRDLDGLPLAIELAAARVRMVSVEQIADGLDDRFRLLTGGPRGALPRHQTLRASVDWSYDLLAEPERVLFRRLAVFSGGWSLEALEAVVPGEGLDAADLLDLLTSLVDKSLVVADATGRVARYGFLETVRQYAAERLAASGELPVLRDRHLGFFRELAEHACRELSTPGVLAWLATLGPESANIRAAIDHALAADPEQALGIGVALTAWWKVSGQFAAGQRTLAAALEATDPAPRPLRARAVWSCGHLAQFAGDAATARRLGPEALAMAEAVGDQWTLAMALHTVATAGMRRDPRGIRPVFLRGIELARRLGDPWVLMVITATLGRSCLLSDDIAEAERWLREAGALTAAVGVEAVTQISLGLALVALEKGDFEACFRWSEQAVSTAAELGDPLPAVLANAAMARAEMLQGRAEEALERARGAEGRAVAKGAFMAIANIRLEVGRALAMVGRTTDARDLLALLVAGGGDGGAYHGKALALLADALWALGDVEGSQARAREALALGDQLGIPSLSAAAREVLARLALGRGEWREADSLLHEALARRLEVESALPLPDLFDALAQVAGGLEADVEAARLLGAADRARRDRGIVRWPLDAPAVEALEERLAARLGPEALAAARGEGAAMPPEDAVRWLRRARGARKRPTGGWESLTPTEQQVVELVAQGLSNPQIAEKMFVSRGTVKVHLGHVFSKLDVSTRTELAARAVRRDG